MRGTGDADWAIMTRRG